MGRFACLAMKGGEEQLRLAVAQITVGNGVRVEPAQGGALAVLCSEVSRQKEGSDGWNQFCVTRIAKAQEGEKGVLGIGFFVGRKVVVDLEGGRIGVSN